MGARVKQMARPVTFLSQPDLKSVSLASLTALTV
jgi:hypothetical protein